MPVRKLDTKSYLFSNKMLYLCSRLFGKPIGVERPTVLCFRVVRLRKHGFVHVESTVESIILVPFVLETVDFIIHRRSRKVEL
jgi:hypothetical protein